MIKLALCSPCVCLLLRRQKQNAFPFCDFTDPFLLQKKALNRKEKQIDRPRAVNCPFFLVDVFLSGKKEVKAISIKRDRGSALMRRRTWHRGTESSWLHRTLAATPPRPLHAGCRGAASSSPGLGNASRSSRAEGTHPRTVRVFKGSKARAGHCASSSSCSAAARSLFSSGGSGSTCRVASTDHTCVPSARIACAR